MPPIAALALVLLQGQPSPTSEALGALASEVAQLRSQVAGLEQQLRQRDEKVLEMGRDLRALREEMKGWTRDRPAALSAPFLSAPPPSSDTVGVAKVAVFAPRVEVDSLRRHDIVFLKVRRVEAEGLRAVAEVELGQDVTTVDLPVDQNGALYLVDWSTSEGHSYSLTLKDGASGLPVATVQVKQLQSQGRFIFVGYGVE